jgi:hypothetical protein
MSQCHRAKEDSLMWYLEMKYNEDMMSERASFLMMLQYHDANADMQKGTTLCLKFHERCERERQRDLCRKCSSVMHMRNEP